MKRPLVIAHRGASAVEQENSLAAFRAAARLGADGVELDVHATADGALVVHHDPIAGGRFIPGATAAELRDVRLPNGEPLPTLGQALAACGSTLRVFVEVKTLRDSDDARLLDTLDRGPNPGGYAVHSFDHRIIRRLGDRRPALSRGVLSTSYAIRPLSPLNDAGADTLWQEHTLTDQALVAAIHAGSRRVIVWTVNDADLAVRLARMGVDGICTNAPDRVRAALEAAP